VEDKLIGPLSLKQFFILFSAGIMIFAGYSATKSVAALVILFFIFGLPAVGMAFIKINARPIYKQIPSLIKFFTAPRRLIFHKEASSFSRGVKIKNVELNKEEAAPALSQGDTKTRIREVQDILEKQREEERELVGKIR